MTETDIQNLVRMEASEKGILLWRNNVGCLRDKRGIPVRFGLANDSKKMNKELKSSDLIGIRPVVITPDMVGTTVGVFVAREIKEPNWMYTGDDHEKAQLNFLSMVAEAGGDAQFAKGQGTL